MDNQLTDSAERLFRDHVTAAALREADAGIWPHALWQAVTEAGFTAALLPESAGGFGVPVVEALALVRCAASHAAPIPLAETMLAGWLLALAGLDVPQGVLTLAPVRPNDELALHKVAAGWHLSGTATRVPWGRQAQAVAILAMAPSGLMVARLPADGVAMDHGSNMACEPRDTLAIAATLPADAVAPAPPGITADTLRAAGAVMRSVQIAGALTRVLALCVDYATTRVQFGRPIGKFQAVQQSLAILVGQCATAGAAADMAAEAFAAGLGPLHVGAAKARAGEAASIAAGIAHQVHGAIGFTQDYALHHATRRLWSWRDEFGNEAFWNTVVGRLALAAGPDGLWPLLTAA